MFMKTVKYCLRGALLVILSAGLFVLCPGPANAQQVGPVDRATGGTLITTTSGEREVLIEVQVWGQVNRPGMYRVPVSTDAIGLISYAGGPTEYAALSRVKLVRNGYPRGAATELNLDRYTGSGDRASIPLLESGDVVKVPTTLVHKAAVFTAWVSQAAVVISAYLVIADRVK